MRILITGGCGFLGSNLAASWIDEGAEVVLVDALFRKGSQLNLAWLRGKARPKQLVFHQLDVADADALGFVFRQHGPFQFIAHLAGQVTMTMSLSDPRRDMLSNFLGTFNILESTRTQSPDALLAYSSTNKVYGDLKHVRIQEHPTRYTQPDYTEGLDESTPLDFASPYGCSKGAADQYVRDWYRNFGMKTVVFRHSSIYGGRQFSAFDQGWVGWFCQKALEQKRAWDTGAEPEAFSIAGTGKQVRDILYVDDAIEIYRRAYEKRETIAGEVFNVGGGTANSLSLLELFELLSQRLGLPAARCLRYTRTPRRQSDQDVFVADVRKADQMLGWRPRVSSQEGVHRMLDWTLSCGQEEPGC